MTNAEWHDVRITGTYTPVGATVSRTIDRVFRLAAQPDQFGISGGLTGTHGLQDVTPTYTQAQAGESGFNVVSPTASDAFSSANGTHGLEESSDQPGDLTRMYYGTVDGTRPHHISPQRVASYTANGVGVVNWTGNGATNGPLAFSKVLALTEPGNVITGVVVQDTAGPGYSYYTFNRTTGAFEWLRAAWYPQQASYSVPGTPAATLDCANLVMFRQIGNKVWLPVNGLARLQDVLTPASIVATDNPVMGYLVVGDRLHTYTYLADGSIELNPFDIASDGSLTRTQNSVPANVVGRIKSAGQPVGCCASQGYMLLATATGLYAVSFNDTSRAYQTSLISDLPLGVTGKPVEWAGDVWVPCGNRIFRFTVGKNGNTWMLVDTHGTLPDTYAGDVVQMTPTYDRLVLRQVRSITQAALLTLDGGGAVSTLRWSDASDNLITGAAELAANIHIPVLSYGEPFVCIPRSVAAGNKTLADTVIVPNGSRNPSRMPAAQRYQVVQNYAVWPHQYGVNRQAPKTATRVGMEVDGVGPLASNITCSFYFQRDYEDRTATQTFASGPLNGTGTWHKIAEMGLESLGVDASGSGFMWTELVDTLGNYSTCRIRYRPMLLIQGDPTGVRFPEVRSFIIQRYEWVNKGYLSAYRLRLQTKDMNADPQDERKFGTYEDAADIQAAIDDLQALNDHFVICTVTPVGVDSSRAFKAVLTKYNDDVVHVNQAGKTSMVVSLSLQHVVPSALYSEVLVG